MRSFGQTLIQYDQYPLQKRKFGHRNVDRDNDMKIQGKELSISQGERIQNK